MQSIDYTMNISKTWVILLLSQQLAFAAAEDHAEGDHTHPVYALLFPWLMQILGVFAFLMLTRYCHWFPYTAFMFVLGTFMGVGTARLDKDNQLAESMQIFWIPIDSEVLLVGFLPGLLFKDAICLNAHLFRVSFWQNFTFGFPMVLAGTCLAALVAKYVLDLGWSWNLCMAFGSILSATDPVAVAALLAEVGAPPRLQIHVSGEALLNDGAAIVFYSIFASMYFFQIDPDLGTEFDWGTGIEKFFRMSLGGVAIGIFFAIGLLFLLSFLDRKLVHEENIVQMTASLAIAYLCYYTADVVWKTSGVVAVVTCGVISQAFGKSSVNDHKLFSESWSLIEHLLNSVLFGLGGLVWGSVIANGDNRAGNFGGKQWGYLIALYVLLTLIRFLLFTCAYPLTVNIGLSTCWQEQVFQAYGGLRGAVGIALAIALDNTVREVAPGSEFELQTNELFGYVGGIAFLTLVVNATASAPILRKLGLTDSTEVRKHILENYRDGARTRTIRDMVRLLTRPQFAQVDFEMISNHLYVLKDLKRHELLDAVEEYRKENSHRADYHEPMVDHLLASLSGNVEDASAEIAKVGGPTADQEETVKGEHDKSAVASGDQTSSTAAVASGDQTPSKAAEDSETLTISELRNIFLEIVRSSYSEQIELGEMFDDELLAASLFSSLNFAGDAVSKGKELNDWEFVDLVEVSAATKIRSSKIAEIARTCFGKCFGSSGLRYLEFEKTKMGVHRCLAFLRAHRMAQAEFKEKFAGKELQKVANAVITESEAECTKAEELFGSYPEEEVKTIVSHYFCSVLLYNDSRFVAELNGKGLIKDTEAQHFLEEIQEALQKVKACKSMTVPGQACTPTEHEHRH